MNQQISSIIDRIAELPADWHGSGTVSPNALRSIAELAEKCGIIQNSIETGSGFTTILFSHLSRNHVVFAMDYGESISNVRKSAIFNAQNVRFIEGPTQKTLPRHIISQKIQLALIDGPHGYPFPDLEYYYLYPVIETGGLLLVDDIKIPSIARMYDIIRSDKMFELIRVVDDNMAFFRRTSAELLDPLGDGWWLQGYNSAYYDQIKK
jgi:predicted O-methyltransferase YrrM